MGMACECVLFHEGCPVKRVDFEEGVVDAWRRTVEGIVVLKTISGQSMNI